MSETLEYQVRTKHDTTELKKGQAELKKTGEAMSSVAQAGAGMTMIMTGMQGALRGNVGALLQVAMGAGAVWKSFANLNPVIRILTLVLGAANVVYSIFNKRQEDAATAAQEAEAAIQDLGLTITQFEAHNRAVRDAADAYERIEESADRAATAIREMVAAQLAYNQASSSAKMADIDLREAQELAGATTDEQRREIRGRFAEKRATTAKATAQDEFDIKWKSHQDEGFRIEDDARRQETNERNRLSGNVEDARTRLSGLVSTQLSTMVAKEDFSDLPMDQRWKARANREKEILSEFASDPRAATERYASRLPEDMRGDVGGLIKALESHQSELKKFEAAAPERSADLNAKLQQHATKGLTIGLDAQAAKDSADAGLIREKTAISAEAEAEKVRLGAENARAAEARNARVGTAYDRAKSAVEDDRYNRMSDEEKAARLQGRVRDIRSTMGVNQRAIEGEGDPEKRAALQIRQGMLVEDLVKTMRDGRDVVGRIDADRAEKSASNALRQDQVAEHQDAIDQIRSSRATTAMDTMSVFQHMYSVQGGKNPDEIVAQNTAKMAEHTASISKLLEEASR